MKKSVYPMRIVGLVGAVALLALFLAPPVGALLFQTTPEPTPRETPTSAPYLELFPTQGVAGDATPVTASGVNFAALVAVTLYWDVVDGAHRVAGPVDARGNGTFDVGFTTPINPPQGATGLHTVIAVQQGGLRAEATFLLIGATATVPPPPTNTWTPAPPTATKAPTATFTASPTLTPSPTLRPVTPQVTISPVPPTKGAVVTKAPAPTRTRTPVPGTATNTRTPSVTPTPSNTPGPGTPSATPQPTATPVEEISETGGSWGLLILWGFVLAGLLIVFRFLRVRSVPR